jgi:uncharacterized SAM-binding protein YcdF (DUF218 family)
MTGPSGSRLSGDRVAADVVPRGGLITFPRRRWIAPTLSVVLAFGLLIGVGGDRLYVHPAVSHLSSGRKVDAVVALGGLVSTATYAQHLVEDGVAPVLVLSDPYAAQDALPVHQACASRPAGYRIICFKPDPSTTRGEAREIRDLARANGWSSVAVVAPVFHISRARVLVRRCFSSTLLMIPVPAHVSWAAWTYQYLRQSAGYVKAAVMRAC